LELETQEQALETEQIVQAHVDALYAQIGQLNLLDDHEHCMAHRTIDLITKIREFHRDLENPDASRPPSLSDFLKSEFPEIFKMSHNGDVPVN